MQATPHQRTKRTETPQSQGRASTIPHQQERAPAASDNLKKRNFQQLQQQQQQLQQQQANPYMMPQYPPYQMGYPNPLAWDPMVERQRYLIIFVFD